MYCTFYEYITSIIHRAVHSVGTQIELMSYTTYWYQMDTYNT